MSILNAKNNMSDTAHLLLKRNHPLFKFSTQVLSEIADAPQFAEVKIKLWCGETMKTAFGLAQRYIEAIKENGYTGRAYIDTTVRRGDNGDGSPYYYLILSP
jgi:hypothetical protein